MFAIAELWERWTVRDGTALPGELAELSPGDVLETVTVLTTTANDVVAPLHDRMPVILPAVDCNRWLHGEEVEFRPHPGEGMSAHPVSTWVNNARHDDPGCVAPLGRLPGEEPDEPDSPGTHL